MDSGSAKKITILTVATMFGIGFAKSVIADNTFPPFKFFAANGAAIFLLAGASDIEPELTGPFCLLILSVIALDEGPPLLKALSDAKGGGTPTSQQAAFTAISSQAAPLTMTPPKTTPHLTPRSSSAIDPNHYYWGLDLKGNVIKRAHPFTWYEIRQGLPPIVMPSILWTPGKPLPTPGFG